MTKLKKCQACREMIDYDASVCPKCRSKQHSSGLSNLVKIGLGIAVLAFIGSAIDGGEEDQSASQFENGFPSTATTRLPSDTIAGCSKAIDEAETNGMGQRRGKGRFDVNEISWSIMKADDKRAMLAMLACSDLGKNMEQMSGSEYVVLYNNDSGKRLAMLSDLGVTFE